MMHFSQSQDMLLTIHAFLLQSGYLQTASKLREEANLRVLSSDSYLDLNSITNAYHSIRSVHRRDLGVPLVPEAFTIKESRSELNSVCFHPQYPVLVSTTKDGKIRVWDSETGAYEFSLQGHTASVNEAKFEPSEGGILLTCSDDKSLKVWNFNKKRCIHTLIGHLDAVLSVRFKDKTTVFSASKDRSIRQWDIRSHSCVKIFDCPGIPYTFDYTISSDCIAYAHNQKILSFFNGRFELLGHSNKVNFVKFVEEQISFSKSSVDTLFLMSAGRDCDIRVWDFFEERCLWVISVHQNWVSMVFLNGNTIYSCGDDKSIVVYDISCMEKTKIILEAHDDFLKGLEYSSKFRKLASVSENCIKVWECC